MKKNPGRQLTPAEIRRINDAVADLKTIFIAAKRAHTAKRKAARKCTSKSAPSKQTVCAAA